MSLRIHKKKSPPLSEKPGGIAPASETVSDAVEDADGWLSRLAKLIPAEAVALYGTASGFIASSAGAADLDPASNVWHRDPNILLWIMMIVCLIITVVFRLQSTKKEGEPPQYKAVAISVVSFVAWVFALPADATPLNESHILFTLLAMSWTTLVPALYHGD